MCARNMPTSRDRWDTQTKLQFLSYAGQYYHSHKRETISTSQETIKKLTITVILSVLPDGRKVKPFATTKRNILPKETTPSGIALTCNEKGCTTELKIKWLIEVRDIRLCVPLKQ
jgi:hypothetical protein